MTTCTVTSYFSNGVVIQRRVGLSSVLRLMGHAAAIIPGDADLLEIRGAGGHVLLVPTEICFAIAKAIAPGAGPIPFSKESLWERDGRRCAYCARPLVIDQVTVDHVTPRVQCGQSIWTNLVVSCADCNTCKGGRTPEQAGMRLLVTPHVPKVRLRSV
jgi:hypothetical protein